MQRNMAASKPGAPESSIACRSPIVSGGHVRGAQLVAPPEPAAPMVPPRPPNPRRPSRRFRSFPRPDGVVPPRPPSATPPVPPPAPVVPALPPPPRPPVATPPAPVVPALPAVRRRRGPRPGAIAAATTRAAPPVVPALPLVPAVLPPRPARAPPVVPRCRSSRRCRSSPRCRSSLRVIARGAGRAARIPAAATGVAGVGGRHAAAPSDPEPTQQDCRRQRHHTRGCTHSRSTIDRCRRREIRPQVAKFVAMGQRTIPHWWGLVSRFRRLVASGAVRRALCPSTSEETPMRGRCSRFA